MTTGKTNWQIDRLPGGGWHGSITFDAGTHRATVGADGATQQQALKKAAVLAAELAKSPVLQAVLPPGTAAAIKAVDLIARSKYTRAALQQFAGPGARRLAKALRKFW